jgi:hypothetical protein
MKTVLAKIIITMLAFVMMLGAYAADNSIYIDQSGSGATINITQDGFGNVVRGTGQGDSTTSATLYGDNNQITVNQIGISNTLKIGVNTTTGNGSTNPTVNYSVTGNNATAVIDSNSSGQGTSESNNISVTQNGNNANLNVNVLGSNNVLSATTAGGANNSVVSVISGNNNTQNISMVGGGDNSATLSQTSNGNSIGIDASGASNLFNVTQTGGVAGNIVSIGGYVPGSSMVGNSNTVAISQQGGADNTVSLGMTGNSNNVNIGQWASSSAGNVANVKVNGSSNTIGIQQGVR